MVDIDSIHFKDGTGKIYRCGVCMPDIAAPELIGIPVNSSPLPTFTTQTDLWALAIHIFRLLMYNYHPFSAAVVAKNVPSQVVSQNQRVKNGQTPFFKKEQALTIPKEAAEVNWVFPTTTIELFKQTFIDGHSNPSKRVGAKEWFEELNMLSRNTVTCSLDPSHVYYRGKNVCPWCEVERKIVKNTFSNIKTMGSQPTSTSVLSKPKIQTNQPLNWIDSSNDTNGVNSNDIPDLSENKKKDYEDNYKKKAIAVANKNKPENSFNNQSDSSRINSPNTITDDGEQKAIYNKKVGHPIKRTILESLTDLFQGE